MWCAEAKQTIFESPVLSQAEKMFLNSRLHSACAKIKK
jgi:hypothetical protein